MSIATDNPALWWFGLILVWIVVGLYLGFTQRATPSNPQGTEWGRGTKFFLVGLRLAIGWHILFEGLEKLNSASWSSEAYLREASGPLAPWFRDLAGDALVSRLTPGPDNSFPAALEQDWQAYFDVFQRHYQLDAGQTEQAQAILNDNKSKTRTWLLTEKKSVKLVSPYPPPVEVARTIAERIAEYQAFQKKARLIEEEDLPLYGSVAHAKLLEAKKDANGLRNGLKADLAGQTDSMRKALRNGLTQQQKDMTLPPETARLPVGAWGLLEWTDASVTYGLLAVGLCLLLGVLTRTACVAGALFLLMFYLAMPPLPDWPASPKLEGHYFYINKTFIEMLALLTLATTRSGRWLGLDGLLQFCCPSAWRSTGAGGASANTRSTATPA
jgi:uncharacterized membrane protein YphA (DoxX/SURF4 family)